MFKMGYVWLFVRSFLAKLAIYTIFKKSFWWKMAIFALKI